MAPDVAGRPRALAPGWDRRSPWTLRFLDPELERNYRAAMAGPGRHRFRIANLVGAGIWASIGVIAPMLLDMSPVPFYVAAAVNGAWEVSMVFLTFRPMTLAQVWAGAVASTTLGTIGIVLAFGTGEAFVTIGAAALMTNIAFGIALVRPAGWVAAGLSVMTVLLYIIITALFDVGGVRVFQAVLLMSTVTGATLGARFLEEAERNGFTQGYEVADLHRRIDRLFRQYLSPDVAQALVDDPARADLGGELAEVSVLFADLQGFTAFSERNPAHEVVAMLNTAFGAAVPAVFAEGGTVVQFMGDALMAVFNAPIRQTDHALRACRAALALQRAFGERVGGDGTAGDGTVGDGTPRFRVAINSGPALVGNVGSAEMHNFLAIGDTTNVAARLQAWAPPGSVVLGQPTYELVRDSVEVRPLGSPELKGKTIQTEVYELIGLRTEVTATPA